MKISSIVVASITLLAFGTEQAPAGMMLTSAGQGDGFGLSTFATGFPVTDTTGPVGIAFPTSGGVLVGDYAGNVRLFPTDVNGQSASSIPASQSYGYANATGMAQVFGNIYMNQAVNGQVVQLNGDGTFERVVASIPGAPNLTGMAVDPANGHLFVSEPTTTGGFNQVLDIDPATGSTHVFLSGGTFTDGLAFNSDGSILYAATDSNSVTGFDAHSGAVVFGPVFIPGMPDGVALGTGSLLGNLFVNTNGGTLVEVNVATLSQTVIASGGTRGDLVYVDPHDDSLLLTQTDSILRLTAPTGGGFLLPAPVPEPSSLILLGLGVAALGGYAWRQRKNP
jgi:hypothetical protein